MTKNSFAQAVAQIVNGTAREVEKANGVILTAVDVPTADSNVVAAIYIDRFYDEGYTPEETAEALADVIKQQETKHVNIDFIRDFEAVKPLLRARLYNKATTADVKRSAKEYGLDDLIITAYIENAIPSGSIKVTSGLCQQWNVTAEEVLRIAEENSKKDAKIQSMRDVLASMGYPYPSPEDDIPLQVVSNSKSCYGAYAVIALMDELKARYKKGFTILPSSVHEVLITEIGESLDALVQEVNDSEVDPAEQLSNHAYRIVA